LTELAEAADVAEGNAHREIGRLMDAGIVDDSRVGRTRQLTLSSTSPYAAPLRELLIRAFGPPRVLAESLADITGIEHAFIYEGESGEDPGDIDVLVVGAPQVDEVYEACRRASTRLHREVNATILSESEWASDTVFTREVRSGALIPVVLEVA
jgi:DNA-binding transcriptional ArsR family regulator